MAIRRKILIIDDDRALGELLKTYLGQFDMSVSTAIRPDDGLRLLRKLSPDLVVLDVMLPDKNGFDVCREIRKQHSVPIIMLTARGELSDRVVGLEMGADDYLSKPFEPRELVARIQSVLRRSQNESAAASVLKSDGLLANLKRRVATLNGKDLNLTTNEFEILALFLHHPGTVMSRDQIMEHLRGIEWQAFNRSIDITVSRLRKKLGDTRAKPRFFKTVWGKGYLYLGEVSAHET